MLEGMCLAYESGRTDQLVMSHSSARACAFAMDAQRKNKGVCTHTSKTGAGSDSDTGCNVNKWALSHAAGPDELPARQICVPDWNSTNRASGRLILSVSL